MPALVLNREVDKDSAPGKNLTDRSFANQVHIAGARIYPDQSYIGAYLNPFQPSQSEPLPASHRHRAQNQDQLRSPGLWTARGGSRHIRCAAWPRTPRLSGEATTEPFALGSQCSRRPSLTIVNPGAAQGSTAPTSPEKIWQPQRYPDPGSETAPIAPNRLLSEDLWRQVLDEVNQRRGSAPVHSKTPKVRRRRYRRPSCLQDFTTVPKRIAHLSEPNGRSREQVQILSGPRQSVETDQSASAG